MAQPPSSTIALPRWLGWVASVAILFHLSSVVIRAAAESSGPWPNQQAGSIMGPPPRFALALSQSLPGDYLKELQLSNGYHFPTNRPGLPDIYLELRLKDEKGDVIETIQLPDKNANFAVRHRQELLANALGMDDPVMAPQTEYVAAPHMQVPKVTIWEMYENNKNRLKTMDQNLLLRDRPYNGPSEMSQLFARSFARYLCRTHNAAKVEIIRHHKEPIPVDVLFMDNIPAGAFDEITSNFGEFSK